MFNLSGKDEVNVWLSVIENIKCLHIDNKYTYIKPVINIKSKKEIEYITYELDLHGYSIQEAYEKVLDFVKKHYKNKSKYIKIITGKGTVEKEGLIHKEILNWLDTKVFKPYINRYIWINDNGALILYLNKF